MRANNGASAEPIHLGTRGVGAPRSVPADNPERSTVCRRRAAPRTLLSGALRCAAIACLVGGPAWAQYPSPPPPPQPIFHPQAALAANAYVSGNPLLRSSPAHGGHSHGGHPHSGPTLGPPFLGDSFLAGSRVGVSRLVDPCAPPATAVAVPCEPETLAVPMRCGCFSAGFEMLWIRANFDQNVAMIVDPVPGNRMVDFQYEHEFTPRVWVGWNSARGTGVRVTYWGFDERAETETATAVAGATPVYLFVYGAGGNLTRNAYADLGETLTSRHQLELHATDLELTHRMQWDSLELLGGAGVRIARMDQRLRGEVYDAGGGLLEVVTNDLLFEGAGPTASLQLVRGIGHSGLSFYGRLRGALLMGETRQSIFEMKDAGANEVLDRANQDEVLSVAEMALGLQWDRPLGPRVLGYVRSAYECQVWMDAGGPVDSDSTISLDGITLAAGVRF